MNSRLSPDFSKLWLARTVSSFGSQFTNVALPLTAVLVLDATPAQMGWINAFQQLPMAVFGLLAGVWVDRMRRKPILVFSDFAQGTLLLSIPITAYYHHLSLVQLAAVAFGVGSLKVIQGVADRAYLPSIVQKEALLEGNSKIWFSFSLSQTVGPGMAGGLVSAISAPFVIAIDAMSYFVSGASVLSIRRREAVPTPSGDRRVWADMRFGLTQLARHPVLRPLVLCGAMHNICSTMIVTVYFLYLTRTLGIEAYILGGILIAGGLGSILGSTVSSRMVELYGSRTTLIIVQIVTGIARLLIPLASGSLAAIVTLLAVSELLLGCARSVFNITQISLRQSIIPATMMGRVNASIGFVLWAFTPLGALAAGFLAGWTSMRSTLWVAATGVLLATAWLLQGGFTARTVETPAQES